MDKLVEGMYIGNSFSIERLFSLGDYKNLKVKVEANDLPEVCKYNMMVNQVCDAYKTLFVHQLVEAKLNNTSEDRTLRTLERLEEIRSELLIEEE